MTRALLPKPILVLVVIAACLTPIVLLLLHGDHDTADSVIGRVIDVSERPRAVQLSGPEHSDAFIRLVQSDRLVLVLVNREVRILTDIVHFWRHELWLRDHSLSAKVQCVDVLIEVRPLMIELFLLLLSLVLAHPRPRAVFVPHYEVLLQLGALDRRV